jgi:3-carboxy-cis,cis-muconate cycloisomerase
MGATVFDSSYLSGLFGTAEIREIFSEAQTLQRYLDVEIALARVEARLGLIPAEAAEAIARHARLEDLDISKLRVGSELSGVPIVPLVHQLVHLVGSPLGEYVHWGATTQDITDTGLVLQLRDALAIVERDLDQLSERLVDLARRHRDTPMAGRTKLQYALPITLGFKAAGWLSGIERHLERLEQLKPRILVGQFAGAVGTLASFGPQGLLVQEALSKELGLTPPSIGWHTARDSLAEVICFLGLVSGTLSKIATDVALLMQSEAGEVAEKFMPGRGASSTMPQKRNPITCEQILATGNVLRKLVAAMLDASVHDHERATGPWQAEWIVVPQAFLLGASALSSTVALIEGLEVHPDAMRANLDSTQGLIMAEAAMMALAPHVGRHHAHDLVYAACRRTIEQGSTLGAELAADDTVATHLAPAQIAAALDPANYLGIAGDAVDRMTTQARQRQACRLQTGNRP